MSVYLHMFNRELWRSIEYSYNSYFFDGQICSLLLVTNEDLYISISSLIENTNVSLLVMQLILPLSEAGLLHIIGDEPDIGSYIEKAKGIYEFDRGRYENYFNPRLIDYNIAIEPKNEDTSIHLRRKLLDENICISRYAATQNDSLRLHNSRIKIAETVQCRQIDAVTMSIFSVNYDKFETKAIGRLLSMLYIEHYLHSTNSSIATSFYPFHYFDFISDRNGSNDLWLARKIFFGLCGSQFTNNRSYFYKLLVEDMFSNEKNIRADIYRTINQTLFALSQQCGKSYDAICTHDYAVFLTRRKSYPKFNNVITQFNETIFQFYDFISKKYTIKKESKFMKILALVATDVELKRAATLFDREFQNGKIITEQEFSYFRYEVANTVIFLCCTDMGSDGPGGATLATKACIDVLTPDCVVMLGIAFGLKRQEQAVGDILISKQIKLYDKRKVTPNKEISRGAKPDTPPQVLQKMRMANVKWIGAKVHFGLILTGSVLANDERFIDWLLAEEPEAIGGDMEAGGVYSASSRERTHWIIIKGISDWGYDKADQNQELASDNSLLFFIHAAKMEIFGE